MIYSYNETNEMYSYLKLIFGVGLYMFRTVSLSIIRSLALYTAMDVCHTGLLTAKSVCIAVCTVPDS